MTIGIGCICERGDCVVLASDMRATYGTTLVGPHDYCGKLFTLGKHFPVMACVAGRMSECHAVISQIVHTMRRIHRRTKIPRELVMQVIDDARAKEMRKIYDWTLKAKMGISLQQWAKGKFRGGMDDLVLRAGLSFMEDTPFRVELVVAGFIRGQTMFFRGAQKNRLEEESSPGVYVIGSGQIHAMNVLTRRQQNHGASLPRTLLHVHEAMIAARAEKTVGTAAGYIVMRKHVARMTFIGASSPTLESWRKAYADRATTASLDDSRVAAMDIYQQLKYLHPIKSGINE
jgi:hypothetical protein